MASAVPLAECHRPTVEFSASADRQAVFNMVLTEFPGTQTVCDSDFAAIDIHHGGMETRRRH